MTRGTDWTFKNLTYLSLLTIGYICGEIAHFLINTSSKAVAQDVQFGDKSCLANENTETNDNNNITCGDFKNETTCILNEECVWNYDGSGIQYQILAGTAFVMVFSSCNLITGLTSDRVAGKSRYFGRHTLFAIGTLLFSTCLCLMGLSNAYWQLVVLRMGIAAGEAVCRPISGSLIFDLFTPAGRGVANGVFSWGIYFGYALAYILGITAVDADILGHGWRSVYVMCSIPGFAIGISILLFLQDPKYQRLTSTNNSEEDSRLAQETTPSPSSSNENNSNDSFGAYLKTIFESFVKNPTLLLLLLAAWFRHTAGYCWAYNTRLYYAEYYPDDDDKLPWWLFADSLVGGSFGVFFGGFFSDRIVTRLGLHSRLWVLSAFTMLSVPFAFLTLYTPPITSWIMLLIYYFCAETWFAILFTVIIEVVKPEVKGISIALFLFLMNIVGGNLPIIVEPIKEAFGGEANENSTRNAIVIVWPCLIAVSAVLFFVASIPLKRKADRERSMAPKNQ